MSAPDLNASGDKQISLGDQSLAPYAQQSAPIVDQQDILRKPLLAWQHHLSLLGQWITTHIILAWILDRVAEGGCSQ
ncbi:MAG TPA: hypothetical protein PLE42_04330 [Candidatus Competibacteraceae bacterium]|nr:MAG: hypothetical protein EKK69_00755 [Candidatus Competibacteraceae bacterium]HQC71929.1 hypothetical protein [Candidatus Competibacteraceae bacterium]